MLSSYLQIKQPSNLIVAKLSFNEAPYLNVMNLGVIVCCLSVIYCFRRHVSKIVRAYCNVVD
jgi:hypothetical protein